MKRFEEEINFKSGKIDKNIQSNSNYRGFSTNIHVIKYIIDFLFIDIEQNSYIKENGHN